MIWLDIQPLSNTVVFGILFGKGHTEPHVTLGAHIPGRSSHTQAQEGTTRAQTWPSREGSRSPGETPSLPSGIVLVNFGITKAAKNRKATGMWQHPNTMGRRSSCAASVEHLSMCSVQPGCWAKFWYCLSFAELCAPQRYWAERNPGWAYKQTFSYKFKPEL